MRQTSQDVNSISPLVLNIIVITQTIKVIHNFKHLIESGR